MIFTYKLKLSNMNKVLSIALPFTPYTNQIYNWNASPTGWASLDNKVTAAVDNGRALLGTKTIQFLLASDSERGTVAKTYQAEPNKHYLISCYVRNNGVLTTALRAGSSTDWSSNYFANRLLVVTNSGSTGLIEVNLDFFYPSDILANAWVGGFFLTEITAEEALLSRDDLSEKYVYVAGTKASPSMRDILTKKYAGSPYQHFLTMDGIRIGDYDMPLSDLGVDEDTLLETHVNELPEQVFHTFTNSMALMAMLEGDRTRVSHTYPKMQNDLIDVKVFPRVQFYMGFEVSTYRADSKAFANNTNITIDIYVPITRVTNSMQDSMLSSVVTSLMSDLGFSAIRGSDYFREPEQLYVRQTQYVKDVQIINKVKT